MLEEPPRNVSQGSSGSRSPIFIEKGGGEKRSLDHTQSPNRNVKSRQEPPEGPDQKQTFWSNRTEFEHVMIQCYAVAKKDKGASRELDFKKMPPEIQQQFLESMDAEWQGWLALGAAEVIPPHLAAKVPRHKRIPSRYIHTDKNEMIRTDQDDLPILPKSRLVVLGNLDKQVCKIRTDAPTISELGTHLVFQRAASWKSDIIQADVKQAFLSGDQISREVYMIPPKEGLAGVQAGSLIRLLKSAYGLADAPRQWWLKFAKILRSAGWVESRLERAMFYLYDKTGKLVGQSGCHVDDFLVTGVGPTYERSLEVLKREIKWGAWKVNEFTHCGRDISRDSKFDVIVDQSKYVQNLQEVVCETNRLAVKMTDKEYEQTRGLLGSLGWATKQSQLHGSFGVSTLLSEINNRDRSTIKKANKLLQKIQSSCLKLRFPSALDLDTAVVGVFSDASFANRPDQTSQGAYLVTLMDPQATQGKMSSLSVLSWSTHKVRRVCRSTLSAEAQAAAMAVENGDFVKILLAEAKCSQFPIQNYHQYLKSQKGVLVIDARSVYDYLTSDSGKLPSDKRLALDLRMLQFYRQASDWDLRWVAGPQQLADSLTKEETNTGYLEWVMENAKYILVRDNQLETKIKKTVLKEVDNLTRNGKPDSVSSVTRSQQRSRNKSDNHKRRMQEIQATINSTKATTFPKAAPSTTLGKGAFLAMCSGLRSLVVESLHASCMG